MRGKSISGIIATSLLLALWFIFPQSSFAQDPCAGITRPLNQRKNIDDLSPADLELYKSAVKLLMDNNSDPDSENSYNYFASLHDFFAEGNGCEHQNELFFPWHRALLVKFEKALQQSNAPVTCNVTVPYWVWTKPPTGNRYPKPFEDQTSVLYNRLRRRTASNPPFSQETIDQVITDNPQWPAFAGGPKSNPAYGAIESPYHNDMHVWCGTPMRNPETAAEDPIFWSYHAFIDVIFDGWQKKWQVNPLCSSDCLDSDLRTVDKKVSDVVNIESQLGYTYAALVDESALASVRVDRGPAAVREASPRQSVIPLTQDRTASGVGPFTFPIQVPQKTFGRAEVKLEDLKIPETLSYSGEVYIYPATVTFNPGSPGFKNKYNAGRFSIWKGHRAQASQAGHTHPKTADVYVNVTTELRYLAKTQPGSAWKVTIVINPPVPLTAEERAMQPAERPLSLSEEVQFKGVSLVLDRFANTQPNR